jgi:hypothetical protein
MRAEAARDARGENMADGIGMLHLRDFLGDARPPADDEWKTHEVHAVLHLDASPQQILTWCRDGVHRLWTTHAQLLADFTAKRPKSVARTLDTPTSNGGPESAG